MDRSFQSCRKVALGFGAEVTFVALMGSEATCPCFVLSFFCVVRQDVCCNVKRMSASCASVGVEAMVSVFRVSA